MTRDERIVEAIAHYQQRFRLMDWDIRYDPDHSLMDKDAIAQTDIEDIRKRATIRLRPYVKRDQIERQVVHELTHIVMRDYWYVSNQVIAKTGTAGTGVMDVLHDYLERICETIAEAMTGTAWQPFGKKYRKRHAPFVSHQEDKTSV